MSSNTNTHAPLWVRTYSKFFNFVARKRIKAGDIDLRKVHAHNAIVATTALLMWAYAFLAYFTISSPIPGMVGFFCSLVHLVSPLLFLVSGNMFFIASITIGSGIIHQATFSYFTGGFTSFVLIWFGILPLLTGITAGKRAAVIWTGITTLWAGVYLYLHLTGFVYPDLISPNGRLIAQALIVFGWIFLSSAIILVLLELHEGSERLLNEQGKRIDDLFRVLFHDLANPLGRISIGINVCKREANTEVTQRGLDIASQAADSMLDITQSVRRMYAVSKGKAEVDLSYLNLLEAVRYVQTVYATELDKKKIKLVYDKDALHDTEILVDRISFKNQVLGNIISNAIKFSHQDSSIELTADTTNPGYVIVAIRDHGMGMPQSIIENLYDITKKTSRPGTKGESGTGYGMSIMKSFVEMYQGNVQVVSSEEEGKSGTTIKLLLKGYRK